MRVVIMGCGRSGSALAVRLAGEGDQIKLVDPDPTAVRRLPEAMADQLVVGSGISRRTLEQAGIQHAEAFVALSPSDSGNVVAARIARDFYHVPRVIGRLYDPARQPLYTQLGIPTVASVSLIVTRTHRLLHHRNLEPEQTFGNGETLLVRAPLPGYLTGREFRELNVEGEIQVVEVSRHGHSLIPGPATVVEEGDMVSFVVASGSLGRLRSFLGGKWQ
jgi:trk system potassium uptake protein TrkA